MFCTCTDDLVVYFLDKCLAMCDFTYIYQRIVCRIPACDSFWKLYRLCVYVLSIIWKISLHNALARCISVKILSQWSNNTTMWLAHALSGENIRKYFHKFKWKSTEMVFYVREEILKINQPKTFDTPTKSDSSRYKLHFHESRALHCSLNAMHQCFMLTTVAWAQHHATILLSNETHKNCAAKAKREK